MKAARKTRRKHIGVKLPAQESSSAIIDPEVYGCLCQVQAYLQMISLSQALQNCQVTADELYRAARDELELRLL